LLLAAALVAAALLYAGTHAAAFLASPAGTPARSDAIFVLGGDAGERVIRGLELYRAGLAPVVVLTGIEEGAAGTRRTYLNWRARYLVEAGVPESAIVFDTASGNSSEEARNARTLARARGWHAVMVVSDPPHMRRLALLWDRAFEDSGIRWTLVASHPAWWSASGWWRNARDAQFVLMEYIKLAHNILAP
jgi:uncharacterized SAM-binding protein YcdF (DUF218 family)